MQFLLFLVVSFTLSFTAHAGSIGCQNLLEDQRIREILTKIEETAAKLKERGLLTSPVTWRAETASFGLPALDLPIEVGG